jgi:hypothetical protein
VFSVQRSSPRRKVRLLVSVIRRIRRDYCTQRRKEKCTCPLRESTTAIAFTGTVSLLQHLDERPVTVPPTSLVKDRWCRWMSILEKIIILTKYHFCYTENKAAEEMALPRNSVAFAHGIFQLRRPLYGRTFLWSARARPLPRTSSPSTRRTRTACFSPLTFAAFYADPRIVPRVCSSCGVTRGDHIGIISATQGNADHDLASCPWEPPTCPGAAIHRPENR